MDKKTRTIFLIFTLCFAIGFYSYVPILSSFAKSLGASAVFIGFIVGAFGMTSLFLRIPFSFFSDYLQRKKPFITGGVFFALLAALLPCFVQTPFSLFLSRALAGVAVATWVHSNILFASYYPPEKMAFAIGLINAFGSLGNFLGTLVCAAVAPRWGNVGVYTAAAMFAACALFMSVFWVKETKPQEKGKTSKSPSMSELFSIAKIPDVVFFAVLAAVALFVFYATGPSFTPLVAEDFFAVNKVQLSILSSISLLASAASSMLCGAIPVRFNSKHILIGAFAVVALVNTLTPFAPGYVTLCILQATNSFVSHFLSVYLQVLVVKTVATKLQTAATGFYQTIYALGITFGPIGAGTVQSITGNYHSTYAILSLLPLVAMLAIIGRDRLQKTYKASV